MHTYIDTCMHTYTHTHGIIATEFLAYVCGNCDAIMDKYIHTYIHTQTHTYILTEL